MSARILIAEDHPQIVEAMVRIVSGPYEVAGTISRGAEVLSAALLLQPEVILLDISLPGRSGLLVLPELRALQPDLCIIMLTNHNDPAYRTAAFEGGADAYIEKENAVQDLLPAITQTLARRIENVPSQAVG
jgi:DNA-binding NarL/FixJ family response regulator